LVASSLLAGDHCTKDSDDSTGLGSGIENGSIFY
jgi:hypothetical protein